jgi:glutaredoxin
MVTLYCTPNCPSCAKIEDILKEISLAHDIVLIQDETEKMKHFSTNIALPILKDEHIAYAGQDAIITHLGELTHLEARLARFQTGTCCCNEKK